jgi:D-alanine-D-alanine ligase-like ATP-grasp enzyme
MELRGAEVDMFIPYAVRDGALWSEYDEDWFRRELEERWFAPLGVRHTWREVTIDNVEDLTESVAAANRDSPRIVFNTCDGTDGLVDDLPGASAARALARRGLIYTGADEAFYHVTDVKTAQKRRLTEAGVPTAPFAEITEPERDVPEAAERLGFPLLIKPVVSYHSNGLDDRSVVHDVPSAIAQAERLLRGDGLLAGDAGIFVEPFLGGREYTVFLIADREAEGGVSALLPVERRFSEELDPYQRMLTQDRYWDVFECVPAPEAMQARLEDVSVRGYRALAGRSYARVDLRCDASEEEVFILEVNATPGLDASMESNAGRILKLMGMPIHEVVEKMLVDAIYQAGA